MNEMTEVQKKTKKKGGGDEDRWMQDGDDLFRSKTFTFNGTLAHTHTRHSSDEITQLTRIAIGLSE